MRMRSWMKWSAWLCLSLMLWTVAAESTHNHTTQTEANSCSICVVAHSASPAVVSGHTAPVFAAVGLLQEEDVLARARFEFSELGIRGPPTAS
jgi:hypothetical protein